MRAQVNKPLSIESEETTFTEQINNMFMKKVTSISKNSKLAQMMNNTNLRLLNGVRTGVSMVSALSQKKDNFYSFALRTKGAIVDKATFAKFQGDFNLTESISATLNISDNTITNSKFLPISPLSENENSKSRSTALFVKCDKNKRLLETPDLKTLTDIKTAQNIGGSALLLSIPSYFKIVAMKGISNKLKLRFMKGGLLFIIATGGALLHYNWQFCKFLNYLDTKYFYGCSLKDLENKSMVKTNKPLSMDFEEPLSHKLKGLKTQSIKQLLFK